MPTDTPFPPDPVCEHGTALDVHCCNCHSGFLFDADACVCTFRSGRYFLSQDNDSHWFVVPASKRVEWDIWLEIDSDDERAWTPPEWAHPINGSPSRVQFESWSIR